MRAFTPRSLPFHDLHTRPLSHPHSSFKIPHLETARAPYVNGGRTWVFHHHDEAGACIHYPLTENTKDDPAHLFDWGESFRRFLYASIVLAVIVQVDCTLSFHALTGVGGMSGSVGGVWRESAKMRMVEHSFLTHALSLVLACLLSLCVCTSSCIDF